MLFPGFVTYFIDERGYLHLYFFPGIDNYNSLYYNKLDLNSKNISYKQINNHDGSIEYIFKTKNIIKINCKLISKYNDITYKELIIKN